MLTSLQKDGRVDQGKLSQGQGIQILVCAPRHASLKLQAGRHDTGYGCHWNHGDCRKRISDNDGGIKRFQNVKGRKQSGNH